MNDSSNRSTRRERRVQVIQEKRLERQRRRQHQKRNRQLVRIGLYIGAVILMLGSFYTVYSIFADWRASQPPEGVASTRNVQTGHSQDPINYGEGLPPVGGIHSGTSLQPCAFYDAEVPSEYAVHSLEHGAIWVTYRPNLPASQIAGLRKMGGESKVLVSAYPSQPSPVVATAWGTQLELEGADDPDLAQFIRAYKGSRGNAPEASATC